MNFNQLFSSPNPSDYSFINNDENHSLSMSKGKAPMFNPPFETGATSLSVSKGKDPMVSPGLQTGTTSHEGDIDGNNVNPRRKPRGRPRGSKNKSKVQVPGSKDNPRPKPRGRPRGSKNKSKVQVPEKTSFMKSTLLEIPSGTDIVSWVREYAQSRQVSVNVIAGSGIVTQAVVSQLMLELRPSMYTEHHRLFSLSGICMCSPAEPDGYRCFTAVLGRMDGSVVVGEVERLLTVGPVWLTAIIANNMAGVL